MHQSKTSFFLPFTLIWRILYSFLASPKGENIHVYYMNECIRGSWELFKKLHRKIVGNIERANIYSNMH